MRRHASLVLAVAALAAALGASAFAQTPPPVPPTVTPAPPTVTPTPVPLATSRPLLRIVHATPFVVQGLGFKPGERVTLKGRANITTVSRLIRSTTGGSFTVNLGDVHYAGCSAGAYLKATGSLGSVAVLRILARMCAQ